MPAQPVVRPRDLCDSDPFTVRRWSQPGWSVRLCSKAKFDEIYGGDRDYYIADGPHAHRGARKVSDAHHRARPQPPAPPAVPQRLAGEPEEV